MYRRKKVKKVKIKFYFFFFQKKCLKEKLEMLVNENPTYFYDILPYTYVLGVSNKWIKKFESINVNPPTWYNYSDSIDIFMTSTMNTFNYIMTASPIKYNPSWDSKSS